MLCGDFALQKNDREAEQNINNKHKNRERAGKGKKRKSHMILPMAVMILKVYHTQRFLQGVKRR